MQWVLIYMVSPFIGLMLTLPALSIFGCTSIGEGMSCSRLPDFLEDILYSGVLFSTWGAVVTIPSGLILLIILSIDSHYRHYKDNKKD